MAKFNWGFTEFSPTQASADYCCLPDVVLRAGKKGDKQWLYDKQADQTDAVIFSPRERERERKRKRKPNPNSSSSLEPRRGFCSLRPWEISI